MKTTFYLTFFLLMVAFGIPTASAQQTLSASQLALFRQNTEKKINDFQNNLGIIASRDNPSSIRETYKKETLKMFINQGVDRYMQVSSKNNAQTKSYTIPEYLNRMANLNQYARVEIKAAELCYVSSFNQVGTDSDGSPIYAATGTITQEFIGYSNDGSIMYRDVTKKTVEVNLSRKKVIMADADEISPDKVKYIWIVLLGDFKVASTILP